MKPFGKTTSVCPVCLGKIPAQLVAEADGIYMHKSCWEHGDFRTLIWEGEYAEYMAWGFPQIEGHKEHRAKRLYRYHLDGSTPIYLSLCDRRCNMGTVGT